MYSVSAGNGGGAVESLIAEALQTASVGDYDAAEALLVEAVRQDPHNLSAFQELGRLMMRRGEFRAALAPLRRVASGNPGSAEAHADLGAVLAALGELNRGLDELELAAALDENNETAREGIAILRARLQPALAADGSAASTADSDAGHPAGNAACGPKILVPGRNIWFVGNSQLITSILRAYCPSEELQRVGDDWSHWREGRVTRGSLRLADAGDVPINYASCGMPVLRDPSFVGGKLTGTPGMTALMDFVDADATDIVVMLRGNEFAIEALAERTNPWDFSYKDRPAQIGRQFIAQDDVLAHLAKLSNPLLATCLLFREKFPRARVYHVAAPPPVESEEHIRANPEIFGRLLAQHGVRPFAVRKKIYDAMYDGLADRLREHGVETIFTPAECLTEAGGLRTDYAHGCLHGNDAYGRALTSALRGD